MTAILGARLHDKTTSLENTKTLAFTLRAAHPNNPLQSYQQQFHLALYKLNYILFSILSILFI